MAIQIVVAPDFFFHEWDGGLGELWLCLRAYVDQSDFKAFLEHPHDAGRYAYVLADEIPKSAGGSLTEVVLPADADIWIATTDVKHQVRWSEYARRRDTLMDAQTFSKAIGTETDIKGVETFPWLSNEALLLRSQKEEPDVLRQWSSLSLNAGQELSLTAPCNRLWSTKSGSPAAYAANPPFQVEGGSALSATHWWLGQMHRLGQKADGSAAAIRGLDIVISWGPVTYDGVTAPIFTQHRRWAMPSGAPPSSTEQHRNEFVSEWFKAIPATFGLKPSVTNVARPERVYWDPRLTNFRLEEAGFDPGAVYGTAERTEAIEGDTLLRPDLKPGDLRSGLQIVQVRLEPPKAGLTPSVTPGLLIRGRLRPYRRFRAARSTDVDQKAVDTPCIFEPDADCARHLSRLLGAPPESFWKAIEAATILETSLSRTWNVARGLAGALPWDGPEPHLRVLLSSNWKSSAADQALTFDQGRLELFLPLAQALVFEPGVFDPPKTQKTSGTDVFFARGEPALLSDYAGLAPPPAANAFRVITTGAATRSLAAVYGGEFEFKRSESLVRTEAILDVTTPSAPLAPSETPVMSFAEDLASYNTLRLRRADLSLARDAWTAVGVRWADKAVHDSLESCGVAQCGTAQASTQVIPVAHSWPQVPSDAPELGPDDWQAARTMMAEHYAVGSTKLDRDLLVVAQHTYAAKLGLGTRLDCALRPPWPVELATAAEAREDGTTRASFLTVVYDPTKGVLRLTFNAAILKYDAPQPRKPLSAKKSEDDVQKDTAAHARATRGVTAWRSLAEICRAQSIWLEIEPVAYRLAPKRDGRLPETWREALVRENSRIVDLSPALLKTLTTWAELCFGPADPRGLTLEIPVDDKDWMLADRASVAQVWLHARRLNTLDGSDIPDDGGQLASGSKAGQISPDTPSLLKEARTLTPDMASLTAAHRQWRDTLTTARDTITPEVPAAAKGDLAATARDAIISELVGTDWFAPPGAPDYSGLQLDSLLVPMGFANLARSTELGALTAPALERLALAIQDFADLAFPALCPQPPPKSPPGPALPPPSAPPSAPNWPLVFQQLAALGQGLEALISAIAQRLTIPQPDAAKGDGVDPAAKILAQRLRPDGSDAVALGALRAEVLDLLRDRPAVFAEAKALLLTVLKLDGAKAGRPDLSTVAAARYRREIRPEKPVAVAAGAAKLDAVAVTAELSVRQTLGLTPPPGSMPWSQDLAFLEVLADSAYDNAFDVVAGGQTIDPFEAAIDPTSITKPWTTRLPRSPRSAENSAAGRRAVPLASRAPLLAPLRQRAQAIPGFQNIGLKADQKVSSGELLRDPKLSGLATPDLYVAGVWPAAGSRAVRVDQEIFTVVYVVRGDEEGETGSPDMFENDRFYPRISFGGAVSVHTSAAPSPLAAQPAAKPLPPAAIEALKALSSAERQSNTTYGQIVSLSALLPDIADRLIFPNPIADDLGYGLAVELKGAEPSYSAEFKANGPPPKGLVQLSLLRRLGGEDRALAWIVADFAAEVWSPLEVALVQGRNTETKTYAFGPEFRQAETSLAARHQAAKESGNLASDWRKPGRMLTAPDSWWGAAPQLADLLTLVAKPGAWWSFDLGASKDALDKGFRLSVTVFQEQFLQPPQNPGAAPAQRFPLLNVQAGASTELSAVTVPFDEAYTTFSLDLQWYSPTGTSALRLERLFVDFTRIAKTKGG